MKELDDLFDAWKKEHEQRNHKRFIRDGIVDETWWLKNQEVPKICFFLKEARTEQEIGYSLVKELYNRKPWRLWQKVAVWTQAIQNAFTGECAYNEEQIKERSHTAIREIAVVNVKKSDGLKESDNQDLEEYANKDREKLKKELEIVNPDIIVCGYTFGLLRRVLGNELEIEKTSDTMYGFWKDKLVIDYYHPACHYPNRVNYYALMSICRVAKDEWMEKKNKYAR